MTRTYRIILVALIGLLAAACASQNDLDAANARIAELERERSATASTTAPPPTTTTTTTPRVQTILGSAVATWSPFGLEDACGSPEIHEGASVVVRDASGIVIGATQLGNGEFGDVEDCEFRFTVDVPANIDFYEFEVAQQSRAAYSNADLVSSDWQVSFPVD
jgi:hypothetical protein